MAWCGAKDKNNYTNKKYHNGRTAPKSNRKKSYKQGQNRYPSNTCDRSLSLVGTDTSQKSDGIELVLWTTQAYATDILLFNKVLISSSKQYLLISSEMQ
jgi:hypothetical protein